MIRTRVIPCLLLLNRGLVKTVNFTDPKYLGDPINIVRIFNDKMVDELIFLDITATSEKREPPFEVLANITNECFMPFGYGGGIRKLDDVKKLLHRGIEKIVLNTAAVELPQLISESAEFAGSQAVVVSIDVRKNNSGSYEVFTNSGKKSTGLDPVSFAKDAENRGAGEIFLNSIDRDGTMQGYDVELIQSVSSAVNIPVVACGGAGKIQDLADAIKIGGASAAAAGSIFVYQGPFKAVLISYPSQEQLHSMVEG
jgi:cyclase